MTAIVQRDTSTVAALKGRRLVRRAVFLLAAILAIVVAATTARHWWTVGRFVESTDDAYVGGDVTAIAPHVPGFVARIDVADNERVKAGQLLVTLDDRDMRAALDKAEAVERERRAKLAELEARAVLQASSIESATADLDAKAAQSAFALADAKRYTSFANSTAVTRQETDRAVSIGAAAKATLAAARATLDASKQQLVVLRAQVDEAKAEVAQAEADGRAAALDLGYTRIRSPVDGFVGNRAAHVGTYVATGGYLATIIPAKGLWVDANFKEDQLAHIRIGDPATVVADVAPDHPLHGHVASLSPGTGGVFSIIPPENATGNFTKIVQRVPIRIALDGDDGALGTLRPGLSTTVSIDTRRARP